MVSSCGNSVNYNDVTLVKVDSTSLYLYWILIHFIAYVSQCGDNIL